MLAILALTLAAAAQGGPLRATVGGASRLQAPRDSTPYARTLEESAGPGWRDMPELSLAPGGAVAGGAGVAVRMQTGSGPRGMSSAPAGAIAGAATALPRVYEVTIQPGTGFNERFLFQEVLAAGPRPLLVVFHKFGVSHYDGLLSTSFFEEARRRGWFCIAPLGSGQTHFSDERSQIHTEAALDWARALFNLDLARVYGVGFSMGGGAALNYAARHLDPQRVMFAAVFNESGILSHEDTYPQSSPVVQAIYDQRFGNGLAGSAEPWKLQRSSVFSFDPFTQAVDLSSDLGRNLLHLATHSTRTSGDIPYLITQNDLFHAHLLARGADPARHALSLVNYPGHSWDAVSEKSVCDWFRGRQLALPSAGDTLADRDARYFHFHVEQDLAGAFTPFSWSVQTATNAVSVSATANLARLRVEVVAAGLTPTQTLQVTTATADGLADEVVLADYVLAPSAVLRDGAPTALWSYDANLGRVSLFEFDGAAAHVWTVFP